jgi:hypothetical protein
MSRNITSAILAAALVMAPSFVLADSKGGGQEKRTDRGELVFDNRGDCQRTLIQLRNDGRKIINSAVQTGGLVNQVAKPIVDLVCKTAILDGKTVFVIDPELLEQIRSELEEG